MLNAIEPGSPERIHRHRHTSETVVCLHGRVVEAFYDDLGMCTDAIELSPGGAVVALNVPIGQWHSIRALESSTVVLAVKEGEDEVLGKKM